VADRKHSRRGGAALVVAIAALLPSPCGVRGQEPDAWLLDGGNADRYRLGLDRDVAHSGRSSLRLEARGNRRDREWAVAVQMLDATPWRGRRIRLGGWLRTEDVGSGHLWMRIDGIHDGEAALVAVDNMEDRYLEDTNDWTAVDIVLDVPPESVTLLYGVMITGDGTVWADDLTLDEAPAGASVTAETMNETLGGIYERPMGTLPEPRNLDFETAADGG